jgi:Xaa-Pro aminopeptidase
MNQAFFARNRQTLIDTLSGGFVVLSAYSLLQRSNDAAHGFQQEANFWYVTGITEPDWLVILDGMSGKSWLVSPAVDDVHRTFEGELSDQEAVAISGISTVIPYDEYEALLRRLAKNHSVVRTVKEHPHSSYYNFIENPAQKRLVSVLDRIFTSVLDCRKELAQLRAIKQPEEIVAIKKAIKQTTQAFEVVRDVLPNLRYEYEVEAEFIYQFKKHGLDHAYDPIVAGGKNACTLHYGKNSAKLKKNSLLLMDIGALYDGYAADITRTFSYGQPTNRQQQVHAAVKTAHETIIALLKPGLSMKEYDETVDHIMKRALVGLRLMKNEADDNTYRRYFPHAISHGLGIDVHDSLGGIGHFQPGMVLTVEPGIYIPEEGIGVRIEDDILITEKGHENLSRHLSTDL